MHPPSASCNALYRLNSSARLAWAGEDAGKDVLNAGSFALVQLYPLHIVGSLEHPNLVEELWDVTTRANPHGGVMRARSNRGPIFNRFGGTRRDWDPLFLVPVYVARLMDYGITNEMVQSGEALATIRYWMVPIHKRVARSQEKAGRDLKNACRDIGREGGKYLWRLANKTGESGPIVPWKMARKEVNDYYKAYSGIENYFSSTKVMR